MSVVFLCFIKARSNSITMLDIQPKFAIESNAFKIRLSVLLYFVCMPLGFMYRTSSACTTSEATVFCTEDIGLNSNASGLQIAACMHVLSSSHGISALLNVQ